MKLHFLQSLPIQDLADRWISRFTAPFARTLSDLATAAEGMERYNRGFAEACLGNVHSRHT